MVVEKWIHETDFGTEEATLTTYEKNDYFVNMGCILWDRSYKRYSSAKKYLEKCGYIHVDTRIIIEK